ncbi:hypothetical protein TNCV_2527771 [Trichonephila clavipes]|nr:hypothetical protein TNCV_2527771 [Trichonephila clavipes]
MSQTDPPLPLCINKRHIYSKLQINRIFQYDDAAAGKRWNIMLNKIDIILSSLPRSVRVTCFRLLTGHDYFQSPLHLIGVKQRFSYCGARAY